MATPRLRSKLLATGMAAVLLLPYTAPSVCGVLGRMGSAMELSANAGDSTVRAPESSDMCCTLNECGIPQVAPLPYALSALQQIPAVRAELPRPPSAHPTNALLPLTPPPQA